MATDDPLKSFVNPLHLVLIQNKNLTNGNVDGMAFIVDENLHVWDAEPTKKTHHQLTVFSMSLDESDPPSTSAPSQSSGTPTYTMATAINLPTYPEFELQPRDTAPTRFEKYIKRLNNMFTAMSISQASWKKATLLHYAGEETCNGFKTLLPYQNRSNGVMNTKLPSKPSPSTSSLRSVVIITFMSFVRNRKSLVRISPSSTLIFNCWHAK